MAAPQLYSAFARYNSWMNEKLYALCAGLPDEERKRDESQLDAPLAYHTIVTDEDWEVPLWWGLSHFFNHQTHHRGQVTTLLSQLGIDPGLTDLVVFLHDEEEGNP